MAKSAKNRVPRPPQDHPYEVGYARPPVDSQFKPNQSGNPNGRPKGSKNKPADVSHIYGIVLKVAAKEIKIPDGVRLVPVSMADGIVQRIALEALKGKYRQQRLWTELQTKAQNHEDSQLEELFKVWIAYKVQAEEEIAHNAKHGLPPPDLVVHPDQVVIDPYKNTLKLSGVMTRQAKREVEERVEKEANFLRDMNRERVADLEAELAEAVDDDTRKAIMERIADRGRVMQQIEGRVKLRLQYELTGQRPPGWDDD